MDNIKNSKPDFNNSMITTIDNPYDPFTQFDEWYSYDCEKQYYTYSYVDRIANINSKMTEEEKENEINKAFLEIVYYNPELYLVVYKK